MALVVPPSPKATTRQTADGLQIVIPSTKNWFQTIFLGAWLVGWAFAEVFTVSTVFGGGTAGAVDLFLIAWLIGWTVGGVYAFGMFSWSLAGREIIAIGSSRLTIRHEVFGLARSREYVLSDIQKLRVNPHSSDTSGHGFFSSFWGPRGGLVAFDYGPSTVRFGDAIEEAEASQLIEKIQSRVPSLAGVQR